MIEALALIIACYNVEREYDISGFRAGSILHCSEFFACSFAPAIFRHRVDFTIRQALLAEHPDSLNWLVENVGSENANEELGLPVPGGIFGNGVVRDLKKHHVAIKFDLVSAGNIANPGAVLFDNRGSGPLIPCPCFQYDVGRRGLAKIADSKVDARHPLVLVSDAQYLYIQIGADLAFTHLFCDISGALRLAPGTDNKHKTSEGDKQRGESGDEHAERPNGHVLLRLQVLLGGLLTIGGGYGFASAFSRAERTGDISANTQTILYAVAMLAGYLLAVLGVFPL